MNNAAVGPAKVTRLDMRMAAAILICVLTATVLNHFGLKFPLGEMRLEVIQKMTAAISCLLVCQENVPVSRKAGINRLIITAVGGAIGIFVILLDMAIGNEWIMCILLTAGVIAVLYLCKVCKVPYINCRIGGVTFILVTCTLAGRARIYYGIFRLLSTLYGVLVSLLVTWAADRLGILSEKRAEA